MKHFINGMLICFAVMYFLQPKEFVGYVAAIAISVCLTIMVLTLED